MAIDVTNKFGVGGINGKVVFSEPLLMRAGYPLSADDALLFAAWIVAVAESDASHLFEEVYQAVIST